MWVSMERERERCVTERMPLQQVNKMDPSTWKTAIRKQESSGWHDIIGNYFYVK